MNGYLAPVLVTGSRTWSDVAPIHDTWHDARQDGWPGIQVIEGHASGADSIAADWATANRPHGVAHLPMAARWETCAADCQPGHRRERHGVTNCIGLARGAGIAVVEVRTA